MSTIDPQENTRKQCKYNDNKKFKVDKFLNGVPWRQFMWLETNQTKKLAEMGVFNMQSELIN
jgi:hypothetical protein